MMVNIAMGSGSSIAEEEVRPTFDKALDSFLKGMAHGSTLALFDVDLIYWEMARNKRPLPCIIKPSSMGPIR